jgi:hypothetical protein
VPNVLFPLRICAGAWPGFGRGGRQMRRAKPNEPKGLKPLVINNIAHGAEKRTQASYQSWYQSLTAILAPILKKFVWIASALLRIQGRGPRIGRRLSPGGLTSKARMSFRMSRIALNIARYSRLGCSQREQRVRRGFAGRPIRASRRMLSEQGRFIPFQPPFVFVRGGPDSEFAQVGTGFMNRGCPNCVSCRT